jgi:hypothetical protein
MKSSSSKYGELIPIGLKLVTRGTSASAIAPQQSKNNRELRRIEICQSRGQAVKISVVKGDGIFGST